MKATRYKYRYITNNDKQTYSITTWAANEARVIENAERDNVGYVVGNPEIIDTKTFTLPDLQFINDTQKRAFFDVFSRYEMNIEDVMLYDYCTNTTKRKINIIHNELWHKSILLEFKFQADIFGMNETKISNRASNTKAQFCKKKLNR
jgi:hypothetical protein